LFGSRPVRIDDNTLVFDRFCAVPTGDGAVDGRVRSNSSNLFHIEGMINRLQEILLSYLTTFLFLSAVSIEVVVVFVGEPE
jgi:hypothetical protein